MTAHPAPITTDRSGIAIATALGGLVIIGVLIAGVFFTSNQELRIGANTFAQERAFRAAEFGLNASLASWDNAEMVLLAPGGTKKIVYDSSAQRWRDSVTITRLNATSYLIVSTGTAFGRIQGQARRRNALLVRLSAASVEFPAALTMRGDARTGGTSLVSGFDTNPPDWTSCPAATDTVAALALGAGLTMVGCSANICLQGRPPTITSTAVADTAIYFAYGDESWSSMTKYATKTYEPGERARSIGPKLKSDGTCDRSAKQNWGDAAGAAGGPCKDYFPIIYAKGANSKLTLSSGSGQGILLVEGDLELAGGFSFNGPIVVRGTVRTQGTNVVRGAIAAANMNGGENSVLGTALVTYSSCAVNKALEGAIPPRRITERAWMEVF
ncbi:MAG: hypothetical protein ACSLFE_00920 [Gemmatimonadaceae bacterium]